MPKPTDIFVGREAEMAALTAALDDVLGDRGRVVMLVGEPGIGKTRTAQQLADIAEQTGPKRSGEGATKNRGRLPSGPGLSLSGLSSSPEMPNSWKLRWGQVQPTTRR